MLKGGIKSDDLLARYLGGAGGGHSPDYPKFRTKSTYEIYSIDLFSYQIPSPRQMEIY